MDKPYFAPLWCFFAGAWAFILGTLLRWRLLPFLHSDTILSGGKEVSTAQAAVFFSKWFFIAGAILLALGLLAPFIVSEAQRRYIAQLPRWHRLLFWPIRTDRDGSPKV